MTAPTERPASRPDNPAATSGELTVTSVFTVTEQHQAQLYALLTTNGHDVLEHTPGFLGSTLAQSDDGRHVIHHARWRDDAALAAMLSSPRAQSSMGPPVGLLTYKSSALITTGHSTHHDDQTGHTGSRTWPTSSGRRWPSWLFRSPPPRRSSPRPGRTRRPDALRQPWADTPRMKQV
ncbi:antibiotic biosynthesis monooxygenase [Micromonospora sp. M12]